MPCLIIFEFASLIADWLNNIQVKGANIGDVFLVSDVVFHDRRIPIPVPSSSFLHFLFWSFSPFHFASSWGTVLCLACRCLICTELVFVRHSQPPISSRNSIWRLLSQKLFLKFYDIKSIVNKIGCNQIGRLSTGDSLDMSTQDESLIIANDATLKDMEVMSC